MPAEMFDAKVSLFNEYTVTQKPVALSMYLAVLYLTVKNLGTYTQTFMS